MFKITLENSGEIIPVDATGSLLDHLSEKKIYVKSNCGGHASCSDCIVRIIEGADNINEPTFDEKKLLGNVFHITKERLACQVKLSGDIKIDISAHCKKSDEIRRENKNSKRK